MVKNEPQTIAQKLAKLEEVLAWFESEEITVEEAIEKYEEALKLSKDVQHDLETAKNKVEVIKQKFS